MQDMFVKMVVLIFSVLASFAAFAANTSSPTKTYTHRLSNKELAELSKLVCSARHGTNHDKINAWTEKPGRIKNIQATVACQPHVLKDHYAVYYKADCQRGDKWACKASETWLHANLDSRQIDIDTRGYKPELAHSLISKIDAYRLPKGDRVLKADTAQCSLGKGPSRELLDITCDDKLIRLSYWCPQSSCPRIFWINGYFVPADAGGL